MVKFEIGKKYKSRITSNVWTCIGISSRGSPVLERDSDNLVGVFEHSVTCLLDVSALELYSLPKKVWTNIYPDGVHCSYKSRSEADGKATKGRIACIEIEFTPGQGL